MEMETEQDEVAKLQSQLHGLKLARHELKQQLAELLAKEQQAVIEVERLEDEISRLINGERRSSQENPDQTTDGSKTKFQAASKEEREAMIQEREEQIRVALEEQVDDVKLGNVPERCKNFTFLPEGDIRRHVSKRIALASYPRSGNSLLRSLIEKLTNIYTGSDADPRRPLNAQLVEIGMKGEGIMDDTVFVVKTHYPERLGRGPFKASRAIVVVRNPFDALVSYFNMVLTETHTKTIEDDEYIKYQDIWETFVHEEIAVWKQFYEHWLHKSIQQKLPLLFIRYEDLLFNRRLAYEEVARFVFEKSSLKGTPEKELVDNLCNMELSQMGSYNPRSAVSQMEVDETTSDERASGDEGWLPLPPNAIKNLRFFNHNLLQMILHTAKSEMVRFGYWSSFFEETYGPAQAHRPANACLIVKKSGTSADSWIVHLNTKIGLRPFTRDDPYGRGFGKRWKSKLQVLPKVRVKKK